MKLSIILTILLDIFATSPDLCAEPWLDANGEPYSDSIGQTLSRYCQWTGPAARVLDSAVCCVVDGDGAACSMPDANGRCAIGTRWYCEYGQVSSTGVICQQPFPDACRAGYCVQAPEVPPPTLAHLACCSIGTCTGIGTHDKDDCKDNGGKVLWCKNGVTNEDGSISCFDGI